MYAALGKLVRWGCIRGRTCWIVRRDSSTKWGEMPYSYLNGVLAAFGFRRDPDTGEVRDKRGKPRPFLGLMTVWGRDGAVQCAQAAEMALRHVGLDISPNTIP